MRKSLRTACGKVEDRFRRDGITTERYARAAVDPVLVAALERFTEHVQNRYQNMRTHILLFGRVQMRALSPGLSAYSRPAETGRE